MKEDILEQLTADYLNHHGYFTVCNVKYKPDAADPDYNSRQDCVASDIDVMAYNPLKTGADRVWVVTCKSWQSGFWPQWELDHMEKTVSGREGWRRYRELWQPKWSRALAAEVERRTGAKEFTHCTAVTVIGNGRNGTDDPRFSTDPWTTCQRFRQNLPTARFTVLDMPKMVEEVLSAMTNTVANSDLGRTLQLLRACGFYLQLEETEPVPDLQEERPDDRDSSA